MHLVSSSGSAPTGMEIQRWASLLPFFTQAFLLPQVGYAFHVLKARSKNISPKNEKDLGMACHIQPLI